MKHITLLDMQTHLGTRSLIARDSCPNASTWAMSCPLGRQSGPTPPRSPTSAAPTALDLRQHKRAGVQDRHDASAHPGDEDAESVSGFEGCRRWAPHAGRLTPCRVPLFRRMFQGAHGCLIPFELSTLASCHTPGRHSAVSAPCAFHHAHGACLAPLKNSSCSPHQRASATAPVTSGRPARARAQARCRPQTVR
jgi:hypothetical protein